MFVNVKLSWNVTIPAEDTNLNGLMLKKAILARLFNDFATKKATKDLGYFVTVTTLEKIGEGKINEQTGGVIFPVDFSGMSFKMFKGEILHGVVHKVYKSGVLLRSGSYETVYLSNLKISGYKYISGENPFFMDQNMSRVQMDTKVRFVVSGTQWIEAEREFRAVASIEGDNLGPF